MYLSWIHCHGAPLASVGKARPQAAGHLSAVPLPRPDTKSGAVPTMLPPSSTGRPPTPSPARTIRRHPTSGQDHPSRPYPTANAPLPTSHPPAPYRTPGRSLSATRPAATGAATGGNQPCRRQLPDPPVIPARDSDDACQTTFAMRTSFRDRRPVLRHSATKS